MDRQAQGGGGEGPPTQEHHRTPPTRETPLDVRAIDAALKNIKNDLPGNNGRAGDDMMATAMIGGGCGCYFGCKLLQGKRSEQKKAGGGVSKQLIYNSRMPLSGRKGGVG